MRVATAMETESPVGRLKLCLVGKEKAGKSRLAATARKPILFLDFDERRESVAGIPGVYAITYHDANWPKQPTAYSEALDDLTKLEQEATLEDFGFTGVKQRPATVVLDSTASLSQMAMAYELFTNADLRRQINFGGKYTVFFPKSFDAWNAEMAAVSSYIMRLLGLPYDIIVTMHEAPEEAPDSTAENPKYTGRVAPFPVRHGRLLRYFNEVWRVERTGLIPTVQLVPDYRFTTATNLKVTKVDKPDICYLLEQNNNNK